MQVYLEYAFLDNMVIDYFLLLSSVYLTGNKIKKLRIFLSALFGTMVAIVLPLFTINAVVSFFVKILLAVVMIYTAGEYKNFKGYILSLNIFILLTFLTGGAVIAVLFALNMDYIFVGTKIVNQGLPVSLMIAVSFILCFIVIKVGKSIYRKKQIFPFIRKCEIVAGEKSFPLVGFIDSGNRLYDSKRGCPIVVISRKKLERMNILPYLSTKVGSLKFNTVSGEGEMPLYKIGGIIFKEDTGITYKSATLGISYNEYSSEYDIILHPSLVG